MGRLGAWTSELQQLERGGIILAALLLVGSDWAKAFPQGDERQYHSDAPGKNRAARFDALQECEQARDQAQHFRHRRLAGQCHQERQEYQQQRG